MDQARLAFFSAFLIALFAEIYGFPLTIYLLSGWLQSHYPSVNWYSRDAGHLLSYAFIGGGFAVISAGWNVFYRAQREGKLAATSIDARVRHLQCDGFVLVMLGFLLQWPTILTLAMFPALVYMCWRLVKIEECGTLAALGDSYWDYMRRVPAFFPRITAAGDTPRTFCLEV